MDWHGEAPFQRFGEAASNSVFGLCDFGMRLLVARERQTRFARWTFPSDDDNQMKMSLPELCRFLDAGMTNLPRPVAAGVQKAPRHEGAGSLALAGPAAGRGFCGATAAEGRVKN